MKIIAVIPARYASSRFPGKPLASIHGKPMIQYVYERVQSVREIAKVYVATDDDRIHDAVQKFGGNVVMTGEHSCGTERVATACKNINFDVVLNVQGDEPTIEPEMLRELIHIFADPTVEMATLKKRIVNTENIGDPNIVKVVTDKNHNAIYFSRNVIPANRDNLKEIKYYKHIGVYGFKKATLEQFINLSHSNLELAEKLEQLRAIENGIKIRVAETRYESISVDVPEHIKLVEEHIKDVL